MNRHPVFVRHARGRRQCGFQTRKVELFEFGKQGPEARVLDLGRILAQVIRKFAKVDLVSMEHCQHGKSLFRATDLQSAEQRLRQLKGHKYLVALRVEI